jgi:hypothetical protein
MRISAVFLGFTLLVISIISADVNAIYNDAIQSDTIDKKAIESKAANKPLEQLTSLPLAKGTFEQRKYFTILKQPIVSKGEVYFDQQLGLIWQTHFPLSSVMRLKKSGLYMQDALTPEREVKGAGAMTQVLMNALSGNISALESEFTFQSSTKSGCVSLLPKANLLANIMQSIDLCMIENELSRIVLFEHSGNRTEIDINLSALTQLPEAISAQLQ